MTTAPLSTSPDPSVQAYTVAAQQYGAGQFAAALATAEAALQKAADADLLNLAAAAAFNLGDLAKAEACWRGAVAVKPSFAEAYNNLGAVLNARKAFGEAEAAFQQAIRLNPANPGAFHNLGQLQAARGEWGDAERSFRRALELSPVFPSALVDLGNLLLDRGKKVDATEALTLAVRQAPIDPIAHYNLGRALEAQRRIAEAMQAYERATNLGPNFAQAYNNFGVMLYAQRRYPEAEAAARRTLALQPNDPGFLYNYANAVAAQHRYDEAEAIYRRIIVALPNYAPAYNNLGVLLRNSSRFAEAEAVLRQAMALQSPYADAEWNMAMLLLSQGRFAEGWPLFRARSAEDFHGDRAYIPPQLPFPEWRGEDLTGKSLFLIREQGIGDEIQCIRFAKMLKQRGAARITVLTRELLAPLFAQVDGIDDLVTTRDEGPFGSIQVDVGRYDYWSSFFSLPEYLCPSEAEMPAELAYLKADSRLVAEWAPQLPAGRPRICLVWRGSADHRNDKNRSLQSFAALRSLWTIPGLTFVSVQKGTDEHLVPPADQPMTVLGPRIRNMSDTAAIIEQVDLVICVDTSVAHLAGAVGKPVWVMVPRADTDWRWIRGRTTSPWYPGVMRVFWQSEHQNWDATIVEITNALREWRAQVSS